MNYLLYEYSGNPLWKWILAFVFVSITLITFRIIKRWIFKRISKFAEKTEVKIDDFIAELVKKTNFFFLLILSAYLGSKVLTLDESFVKVFKGS